MSSSQCDFGTGDWASIGGSGSETGPDPNNIDVTLRGELGIGNAEDLHRMFRDSLTRNAGIEVDLSAVESCDAAVLQLLCSLRKSATVRGLRFRVSAVSQPIEAAAAALGIPLAEVTGEAPVWGGPGTVPPAGGECRGL